MEITPPLRKASYFGWYHELKDLGDFMKCITQKFGEDPDRYAWLGLAGHNGLDIKIPDGAEVIASHDGIVEFAGQDSFNGGPAGLGVVIKGNGLKTIYWHLGEFKVIPGQEVKQGQLIAKGDNTGWSTSSHLHFCVKLLDNTDQVLNRGNGYDGAIDPLPYMVWFKEKNMTQDEVKNIYKLAFYRLPDAGELAYWEDKPLAEFLKTAIKDRADFLNQL